MRVITNPGTYDQEVDDLACVMQRAVANDRNVGALIALLVEKGVLTLEDCMALGAPYMEQGDEPCEI